MSVCFDRIYANEHLKSHFCAVIENNNFPHAVILEAVKGSGRYTLALEIAAAMGCTGMSKPCRLCDNCRKTYNSINPDIITVSLPEGKATISVEQIREVKSMAVTYPSEGDYKFFIIRDCEKMTVQAQNAFLKILEEPPSFVIFILLCTNASLLLPTVVSRAPVFRMQKLTSDELTEFLSGDENAKKLMERDPEGFKHIVRGADGSIGKALENMDKRSMNGALKRYDRISDFLTVLCGNDKAMFIGYEDELVIKKREELDAFVCELRYALRDILALKRASNIDTLFFINEDSAREFCAQLTLKSIVDLIGVCDDTMRSNEMNANINLLKINFMSRLWKSTHS